MVREGCHHALAEQAFLFVTGSTCSPRRLAQPPFQIASLWTAIQTPNPGRQSRSSDVIILKRGALGWSPDWMGPVLHGEQVEAEASLPFSSPSHSRKMNQKQNQTHWVPKLVVSLCGSPPSLSPCESALSDHVNLYLREFTHNTCEGWRFLTCVAGKEILLLLPGWTAWGKEVYSGGQRGGWRQPLPRQEPGWEFMEKEK